MQSMRLIWQCNKCKDIVVSYSHLRHQMDYCDCGHSAVDLEGHYQRVIGTITELSAKKLQNDKWVKIEDN